MIGHDCVKKLRNECRQFFLKEETASNINMKKKNAHLILEMRHV